MQSIPIVNQDKNKIITVDGEKYDRLALKTHVLTNEDDINKVVMQYALGELRKGDILFISEKAVACTQNRAIPLSEIKPRRLAVVLSKYVHKTPCGIGLGIPETMEMALQECGVLRILFASIISAFGKLFKQKGWFYIIAGEKAAGIDGPCDCTLPPYNHYVVLTPNNPSETAVSISKLIDTDVAIVDINDLGGKILGCSNKSLDLVHLANILKDNPLGQSNEQTPMGIIRKIQ